jgi:hypothetical protein
MHSFGTQPSVPSWVYDVSVVRLQLAAAEVRLLGTFYLMMESDGRGLDGQIVQRPRDANWFLA